MKRSLQACIAYIAGAAISGNRNFSLHDCGKERRVLISGTVTDDRVDITHHKKGYHLTGPLSKIRDSDKGIKLDMTLDGDRFKGKLNGTKFKGRVKGTQISLTADGYCSFSMD